MKKHRIEHSLIIAATFCSCGMPINKRSSENYDNAFHFDVKNIASISVENTAEQGCSYILTNDSTNWTLDCAKHGCIVIAKEKLQQYLSYFYYIKHESDSVADYTICNNCVLKKEYIINVKYFEGEEHNLTIFKNYIKNSVNILDSIVNYDVNACSVQLDSSKLYLGLWLDFDILSPNCKYFSKN
jgi:phage anti-repressor protein